MTIFSLVNCFQKEKHKMMDAYQRISTEEKMAEDDMIVTPNIKEERNMNT